MRAATPAKPMGNREWNPWHNLGNFRRQNYGLEGGRGQNYWRPNSGEGPRSQRMAARLVSERKLDSDIPRDLLSERSWTVVRENSNSISVLDRNLGRESGDGNSNRGDISGSRKGKSVMSEEIRVNGLDKDAQAVTDDGLGPNDIFVYGSSIDKANSGRPTNVEMSGLIDRLSLGHYSPANNMLEGIISGSVTNTTGVAECIGPLSVVDVACKKIGGKGRRGFKWRDDMHILDLLAHGKCTLSKGEMELLCVILWRLWHWHNQCAHSLPCFRNENVVAWSSDYIEEFHKANMVVRTSTGSKSNVDRVKWSKPDIGSFKINTDAMIKEASNQVGVGAIIRDSGGRVLVVAV
ncbi:hypothetical protein LWI29_037749 [Acer saccharum]|uniref:RNase H type-1 domain-containing protein n=1 Tax=Acer saccharum TaxID=4024 RepID=A0AA39VUW8_ACESA|nr:hypothetical protein LWI29_037749 [Acer saccharum]